MSGGTLVLVATPIGNLGDLAPRAVEELRRADVIACEDTRRTGRLLQAAGVTGAELWRVDDHTEASRVPDVLARLARGDRVAVVTDAGTPGIADPGERLVRAALDAGHEVDVIPGPSAVVAALVGSGLSAGRFCFEGFLPRKGAGRSGRLAALAVEDRTMVFFEAPHRAARTLADLADALGGDRRVAVARELTKLHQERWRGTLSDAAAWAAASEPRGEVVLVVEGAPPPPEASEEELDAAVAGELARGRSVREAAVTVARRWGVNRREAYERALRVGRRDPGQG